MSEVQSFGSNCHRHSQSRKISIGVMIESSAKKTSGFSKGQEVAVPTVAVANCHQRDSTDGAQVTAKVKQTEPLEQSGSPWITTRSNHEKLVTSPSASHAKVIQAKRKTGRMHDEPSGFKGGTLDHAVKIFPTRTSFLQPDNFFKGLSNGLVYRRKGEDNVTSQIPCMIAQEQEALTSDIGDKPENAVNGKTEALRMKLWELLGTVSSPVKEKHNSRTVKVDGNSVQPDGGARQAGATSVRSRQNSDTIETDSESPDCASKRPVTRSLARKRAPRKLNQATVQRGMPSNSRQKLGERNIFSFQEGWYVGLQGASSGCPSTNNRRKNGRKDSQIEPRKISVQQKRHEKKSRQLSIKKQNPPPTDKSCSGGSGGEILCHVQSRVNGNNINAKGPTSDKDFPKQMTSTPVLHAGVNSPDLPEDQDLQEDIGNPSIKNSVDPLHNPENHYTQRKNAEIEKDKFLVHLKGNEHRIGQVSDENEISPAAQKSGSRGSNANGGDLHGIHSNINRKSIDPRSTSIEKDLQENPARNKMDQREDISTPAFPRHQSRREEDIISPASPGHQSQRADIGNLSFKNIVDPQDGAESPTFGRRSPLASHSLGSQHKETREQKSAYCLAEPELMSTGGGIFSFGNFTSNLFPSRSGRDELQDSPPRSSAPQMQENDLGNTLHCSSSEGRGSERFEEGPGAEVFSPETGTTEKLKFMLHRTKRLHSFKGIQRQGCSPTSVSPKENNSIKKPAEQNVDEEEGGEEEDEDNGLTRAIAMLALALEKLKSKVKLLTSKKSSEILTSVAERIHEQLNGVESQIQTDMCKLTSLSKQKRKRLETEFHEQGEQLKMIHGNFKKEISQLLEDCKGTIEGLENNHVELKATVDKQKTSHQNLILQAQEAVETQLRDAEKRIMAINQSAREQMLQLKLVIADCLEGGVLF